MSSLYPNPLEGFEDAGPLPDTFNADGKSLVNPQTGKLSGSYEVFPDPIDSSNNGFDFHSKVPDLCFSMTDTEHQLSVYYMQEIGAQKQFARALHERIRREFPEVEA